MSAALKLNPAKVDMGSFQGIRISTQVPDERRVRSGEKYTTPQGFSAIRDGVKARGEVAQPTYGKPAWTLAYAPAGIGFERVSELVEQHGLSTVCKEARCPNIGECWNAGTATLMLLGSVCTRSCRFCAVDTGNPRGWLDAEEPAKVARAVQLLGLRYVVLTSVDRDDLRDGGAGHFAETVRSVLRTCPGVKVEALTPDFQGRRSDVEIVVRSGVHVFAQNLETVRRLSHTVRDPRAGYEQTLDVLRHAKSCAPHVVTKSSLMLGFGETEAEIVEAMDDLRNAGAQILTLGQYMRPTPHHLPVQRWIAPREFEAWREIALGKGFDACLSGPLVRSSYRADSILTESA